MVSPLKAQGANDYKSLEEFDSAILGNDKGITSGMLSRLRAGVKVKVAYFLTTSQISLEWLSSIGVGIRITLYTFALLVL